MGNVSWERLCSVKVRVSYSGDSDVPSLSGCPCDVPNKGVPGVGELSSGWCAGEVSVSMRQLPITVHREELAKFCQRHHIRRFALFGSVLREDFRSDSDVDVLVEFELGHSPGLLRLAGMELELSEMFGGRKVDMNTPLCLSRYLRNEVLEEAEDILWQTVVEDLPELVQGLFKVIARGGAPKQSQGKRGIASLRSQ